MTLAGLRNRQNFTPYISGLFLYLLSLLQHPQAQCFIGISVCIPYFYRLRYMVFTHNVPPHVTSTGAAIYRMAIPE